MYPAHKNPAVEYLGMSRPKGAQKISEVFSMCNNGWGGNCCWIIILLILFCGCGNNGLMGSSNNGCGCGCDNNCGCC
jgi:hypothetical protein